jgi:hypothetical protein
LRIARQKYNFFLCRKQLMEKIFLLYDYLSDFVNFAKFKYW